VAIITGSAFAAIPAVLPEFKNEKQLAEWRAEMAAKNAATTTASEDHAFYTGKPYIGSTGGYAFKYRSYNPELARWTSEDPSGYPDGANCHAYAPTPTNSFDYGGLWRIKLLVGNYDEKPVQSTDGKLGAFATISANGEVNHIYDKIQVSGYGSASSNVNGYLHTTTNVEDGRLGYEFTASDDGKLSYSKLGGLSGNFNGDLHLGVSLHIRWDDDDHTVANIQLVAISAWKGSQLVGAGLTVGDVGSSLSWTAAALPVITAQTFEIRLKIVE
jgi:RHS repeat-associated protein